MLLVACQAVDILDNQYACLTCFEVGQSCLQGRALHRRTGNTIVAIEGGQFKSVLPGIIFREQLLVSGRRGPLLGVVKALAAITDASPGRVAFTFRFPKRA